MTKPNTEPKPNVTVPPTEAVVETGKAVVPPTEVPPPPSAAGLHPHKGGKHVKIDSAELESLQAKSADAEKYYDQWLRARAEFDNYRKRVAQEKQYDGLAATEKLLQKLIGILDTFEMALASAEKAASPTTMLDGVRLLQSQFQNVLKESGVEAIDALNQKFDPHFHEAVQQVESKDLEEGIVVRQIRKGYRFKDRLLRPATVIVSKKPEPPPSFGVGDRPADA